MLNRIEREVQDAVSKARLSIQYQRNRMMCRINSLPVEVLVAILRLAHGDGSELETLFALLETCRLWHTVLSSHPSTYSTINIGPPYTNPRTVIRLAVRGRTYPLDIIWDNSHFRDREDIGEWRSRFCLLHIERLRTIEFPVPPDYTERWIIDTPAPTLRRCALTAALPRRAPWNVIERYPIENFTFPCLFGGEAPQLSSLYLKWCRLAWRPGNYRNLSTLVLHLSHETVRRNQLDTDDVTIILRQSPNLHELTIEAEGPCASDWEWGSLISPNSQAVTEGNVRSLRVVSSLRVLRLWNLPLNAIAALLTTIKITSAISQVHIAIYESQVLRTPYSMAFRELSLDGFIPAFLFERFYRVEFPPRLSCTTGPHCIRGHAFRGSEYAALDIRLPGPASFFSRAVLASMPPAIKVLNEDQYAACQTFGKSVFTSYPNMPRLRDISLSSMELASLWLVLSQYPSISTLRLCLPSSRGLGDTLSLLEAHTPYSCKIQELFIVGEFNWEDETGLGVPDKKYPFVIEVHSEFTALIKAVFRHTTAAGSPSLYLTGTILVDSVDEAREFVLEMAAMGVYLRGTPRCSFRIPRARGTEEDYLAENCLQCFDSLEALWPEGLPDEVTAVM